MRKKHHPKRDADFLPAHIGMSFLREMDTLVSSLTSREELAKCGPVEIFKRNYLASEYRSKYCDSSTTAPELRRSNAINKWLGTEAKNAITNQRLLLESCDFGWTTSDQIDEKVRSIISDVLGPLRYPDVLTNGTHTFGASTRVRRGPTAAVLKHAGQAHVSGSCLADWSLHTGGTVLEDQEVKIQDHSVLFTVPKSSDIDRVACKEPEINMFLQRSVGQHIRARLRRVGINLNDQTVNQQLARDALVNQSATIDLSAASDSISLQLVVNWLPPEWFLLLNRLRVHKTEIDGTIHELSMFSSMGNGFTFELESLLFYALTRAIAYFSGVRGRISVYGDDIIAPSRLAPRMARVFSWYGFKMNMKKSSWRGGFRESCGKHYYNGLEVTPFYVREPVTTLSGVIRLLNRLLVWDSSGTDYILTKEVYDFHHKWSKIIPERLWGGQDPEDVSSLVTGDTPRFRLTKRKRTLGYPEDSGLVYWLTTKKQDVLTLIPSKEGRSVAERQPYWLRRATWRPYALYG